MLDINSLLGFQPKTPQISEISVVGGVGAGSIGSAIRTFQTVAKNTGSAITYRPSATAGDSFRINQSGIYTITYKDIRTAGSFTLGITNNQPDLTANFSSYTFPIQIAGINSPANLLVSVTATTYLKEGDIITANVSAGTFATGTSEVEFRIIQVVRT